MTLPLDLIIFDCDGVLVDSEAISIAVLAETFARLGIALDEAGIYRRFLGRSILSMQEAVEAEFGLALTSGHLADIRAELFRRYRSDLRAIDGISVVLDALTIPRCVASSSQPDRIRLSLSLTGLLEKFDPHIYSSTMVKHGKPAPDLFLHAARAMKAEPSRCVVVEDSPAGIEAAKRAGMRVLGFAGGQHAPAAGLAPILEAMAPDAIFDDMRRLPALLQRLGQGGAAAHA